MANLLEETRSLMPGKARSEWSLTEHGGSVGEAKMSPADRWQKLIADFDKAQDYATAKKLMTQIKRMTQKLMVDDPLRKGMRHYMNAETLRYGKLRRLKNKVEAVAGAPGAFAVSDAEPPSFEDAKADLLHHVRNPSWEYPSWALPKVALDEGWDAVISIFDKAKDYATAAKAMKQLKALAAGEDDSHYANAIAHRVPRLRKLKARG